MWWNGRKVSLKWLHVAGIWRRINEAKYEKKERWKNIMNLQSTAGIRKVEKENASETRNTTTHKWKRAKLNKNYDIPSIKINYVIYSGDLAHMDFELGALVCVWMEEKMLR